MYFQSFETFLISLYRDIVSFSHSGAFAVIKFLIGIYVLILFADIVLLLIKRGGIRGDLRETLTGMNIPDELTSRKKKLKAKWIKIRQRFESPNKADYKVAIIEADNVIDNLISGLGYKGENMSERLNNIPDSQVASIEGMKEAHEIRNRIINDESFTLSREDAENVMEQYEEFLRHFQVLD